MRSVKIVRFWQKGCDGGCYVFRIKKALKQKPDLVLFPIDHEKEIFNCRPQRDEDLFFDQKCDDILHF